MNITIYIEIHRLFCFHLQGKDIYRALKGHTFAEYRYNLNLAIINKVMATVGFDIPNKISLLRLQLYRSVTIGIRKLLLHWLGDVQ